MPMRPKAVSTVGGLIETTDEKAAGRTGPVPGEGSGPYPPEFPQEPDGLRTRDAPHCLREGEGGGMSKHPINRAAVKRFVGTRHRRIAGETLAQIERELEDKLERTCEMTPFDGRIRRSTWTVGMPPTPK